MAPSILKAYHQVVQESVSLGDTEWDYDISSLPTPFQTNAAGLVKSLTLTTKDSRHQLGLCLELASPSRAISSYSLDQLVVISFADFCALSTLSAAAVGTQPSTPRECTEYIIKLLRAGVSINGTLYNFYGHSNSQLKSRTCFLFAAPKREITRIVDTMGNFAEMKTVQKKAKRIGLLFSTAHTTISVDPKRCEDISDVETADYIFTDGCGLIAPHLAQELARRINIVFRTVRYTPSVFQIRYRGYKGVVTVDPTMKREVILLKLRKSMKKFSGGCDCSFSVIEYSKVGLPPYEFGHLNDEVILLLHSLGITSEVLLRKQRQHFDFLASATTDPRAAFRFLTYVNKYELAERLLLESLDVVRPRVAALVNSQYAKMVKASGNEQRCRILIPKSRLLFGVCDAWDVLKEGECQVRVTMDGDGLPVTLMGTEVVVTRNPCLHPGDLQKFKVVQRRQLSHLVDCIVFSTKGKRPAADLMSGGDLDGDKFFVSWDEDIIPSTVSQAADYPGAREPVSFKPITDDDRLLYFAKYTNASLGKIKNLYLSWARFSGPMSPPCQELNRLFSTCVDGNRIKVPPKLERPPEPSPEAPSFVLDQLHEAAREMIRNREENAAAARIDCEGYTLDAMEMLLSRDDFAVSEFELMQLTFGWCLRNGASLEDFAHFFNYTLLTAEQKAWALSQLPVTQNYPSLVRNALCQSYLLEESELCEFKLHYPSLRWKCLYTSSRDRLAVFFDKAIKALEIFHRKLIVLRVDERLTIAIYIPQQIQPSADCKIGNKARLFAFPHSKGFETSNRLSLPTKVNYQVYCDSNVFQLFDGQRRNTWVFIGRGASDDSSYQNLKIESDKRRTRQATTYSGVNFDCRASIALEKFSRGLQTHVGRVNRNGVQGAEIYIISNRDVDSLRNLDLWLEYVDTREEVPLFERNAREYKNPTVREVDWKTQPDYMVNVVLRQDFTRLLGLETPEQYAKLFRWLLERDEKETLLHSFNFLLASFENESFGAVRPDLVLGEMLNFLGQCPFLAVTFSQVGEAVLPTHLADVLDARVEHILRAMILSANTIDQMMLSPLLRILASARILSISAYARLMEIIALTVRSPSLALDILLCGLERESMRLIPERPALIRHFLRSLTGIVIEHVEEAAEQCRESPGLLSLSYLRDTDNGWPVVQADFRLDAKGGTPKMSTHVRLTAASSPSNSLSTSLYSMDALVIQSSPGRAEFQCLHPIPPYLEHCSWKMCVCGPFVTTKTMLDATLDLALGTYSICGIAGLIHGIEDCRAVSSEPEDDDDGPEYVPKNTLNRCQNEAVESAAKHPMTCLWGPPGTGKTHTIVEMIRELQSQHQNSRILVTAPTHNAVDNVMRRYLSSRTDGNGHPRIPAVRISTEIRKVAEDLRKYTFDAMTGQELNGSYAAMRAGLGLLRGEEFDIVVIDEASQQAEPASLVPLTKGCRKAILVGDHVQLRPTVGQLALSLDFDVSLFERLWKAALRDGNGVQKVMLDTQYRMHEKMCRFASDEFYEGKLRTGIKLDERFMFPSMFPWPVVEDSRHPVEAHDDPKGLNIQHHHRMVFVDCATPEDLGQKSKCNRGQAALCGKVCDLLNKEAPRLRASSSSAEAPKPSIAVLTPYTRQADLLKQTLSSHKLVEICSIDGFQGREADIVVFVTVRCNQNCEIGFLKDMRRLNVALTRARTGLIIIGHIPTLTMGNAGEGSTATWKRLIGGLKVVKMDVKAHDDNHRG
ncbi:hypothetical protein CORC01_14096 [Colletotrichum orchidophilum]|uniref:AAA+ ATPase domain-containing protein n=1 Tax=Colletotrichum orchidophilum TaxID=1209926 RepID=A0A1G4ANK4_9PEZI|nr:uncharacterized protein CORC01_14096 [Colletotrichum orchidophilum]OHE90612.1 hypothetical protein CORC01_14096 [Colletotrichum orchidophilum]